MPYQMHYAVPHGLLGPWGAEIWAGEDVTFPPGTILFPVPLPLGLRVRLCITYERSVSLFKWKVFTKTLHLNLGLGSVPQATFGATSLNFTRIEGVVGDIYTNG